MDNYEWQKNKAVVDRMYYSERVLLGTSLAATFSTAANVVFMRNNYFADKARARILPTWRNWALFNVVVISMLLRPLTKEEIAQQWRKRLIMGKYLYTLYHLDPVEDETPKEWAISDNDPARPSNEDWQTHKLTSIKDKGLCSRQIGLQLDAPRKKPNLLY